MVLILGSKYDLTCDLVVAQLRQNNQPYLRINSEDLADFFISLNPVDGILEFQREQEVLSIDNNTLRSVFYRRPTYLRDYGTKELSSEASFSKHQWAAFLRNLMVFNKCKWVNHPGAIYYAEHKGVQLRFASELGFMVPETRVTNSRNFLPESIFNDHQIVIKGLDTVLVRNGSLETFGFTNIIGRNHLEYEELKSAPTTFQKPILEKIDIRVTVIAGQVYSVSILEEGQPIRGDWRTKKSSVEFVPTELPNDISKKCIDLVDLFNLSYGSIDLAMSGSDYYFLELNPLGEWAWLVGAANLPLDSAFAMCLIGDN